MEDLGLATTLILKLTRKLSYEELLTALRGLCLNAVPELGPAAFDFAHLPWKKLAVVNFTSPEVCARCYDAFSVMLPPVAVPAPRLKGVKGAHGAVANPRPLIVDLKLAERQGLADNLRFWCLRSADFQQNQPRVFCNGFQVDLVTLCVQLVELATLEQVGFFRAFPGARPWQRGQPWQQNPVAPAAASRMPRLPAEPGLVPMGQVPGNVRIGEQGEVIYEL